MDIFFPCQAGKRDLWNQFKLTGRENNYQITATNKQDAHTI